jgi:RNA polymerase sigma-70 factor (sigma-E family)
VELNDTEHRDFTEYFAARRDTVRRTAYLLCGDWHWADDLSQEAFVRLASAWGQVREPAALDAFVRTCLVRVYLSESKRLWRRRERSTRLPELGHDDHGERVDLRHAFVVALRTLPPRQRATLVYRFYQGLDVEQTAEALGCSTGTVKTHTSRGLAALRGVLGSQFDPSLNGVTP